MKKYDSKIFAILFLISSIFAFGQDPIEVEFNLTGDNLDSVHSVDGFTLTLGLHANASNGPELDEFDIPGSPPSLFVTFTSLVSFVGNETPLIEEFKPLDGNLDSLVWRLQLEFGDPEMTDADNSRITLSWDNGNGGSLFDEITSYGVAELRDDTTGETIQMKSNAPEFNASHTFETTEPNEIREVLIVLRNESNNIPPFANDDSAAMLKDTEIIIDVLSNDLDPDGDDLTITNVSAPSSGTAESFLDETDGNRPKIRYTADTANGGFTGIATFEYTAEDTSGNSASAGVTVAIDEIVATRSHDNAALTGLDSGSGLTVEITVEYTSDTGQAIKLTETLPRYDNALGVWFIPSGSGTNNLNISGAQPDEAVVETDIANFTWNSPLPQTNGENKFTFIYRIVSDANPPDRSAKIISGVINLGDGEDGPSVAGDNLFMPIQDRSHPADTDGDGRITTGEKNRYIGTAVAIVQQGLLNDFQYHFDEALGDFQPGPPDGGGLPSQFHAADADRDGRITTGEKNRFIGTAVAIVQQGLQNDFQYHFDEALGDFQPGPPPQ